MPFGGYIIGAVLLGISLGIIAPILNSWLESKLAFWLIMIGLFFPLERNEYASMTQVGVGDWALVGVLTWLLDGDIGQNKFTFMAIRGVSGED